MLHPCTVHVALTLNVSLLSKLCSERRSTGQGNEAALETADNTRMFKAICLGQNDFMIQFQRVQGASHLLARRYQCWNKLFSTSRMQVEGFSEHNVFLSRQSGTEIIDKYESIPHRRKSRCMASGTADGWHKYEEYLRLFCGVRKRRRFQSGRFVRRCKH